MSEQTTPTRIVELRAENIKRLKAISIKPDGSALIEITGRNGQGKTSILDAIMYALGGKKVQCDRPLRDGTETGNVYVETDNGWIIERIWKSNDKSEVSIRNKDGGRFQSPQDLLDNLVGDMCFDPLAFTRMEPKVQVKTLKALAGLDFDELESLRGGSFDERTQVNREHKAAQAQLDAMPVVADDTPDVEISFADLTNELNAAIAQNQGNEHQRATLKEVELQEQTLKDRIQELRDAITKAQAELDAVSQLIENGKQIISLLKEVDVESLQKRLASAEETNRQVRAKHIRAAQESKTKTLLEKSQKLSANIIDLDQKKQDLLNEAKFPVPGLAMCEHGIVYNGIPFDQASSAERLRVSVAMGLALNPRLKIMLVRDGSLLDTEGRTMLTQMAEESGAQVWMERATDGEAVGIVIEDGEIKVSAEPVPAEAVSEV